MSKSRTKEYEKLPMKGGFDFVRGTNHKPLQPRAVASAPVALESDHQVAVFDFLRLNEARFPIFRDFYAIPNGGHRHGAVAAQLQKEGVRAGILDIALDAARRGFHGLKIELKVLDNDLSDAQTYFRRRHLEENYCSHTCWNYEEAIKLILWYLEIERTRVHGYPDRPAVLSKKGGHDARCGCELKIADLI